MNLTRLAFDNKALTYTLLVCFIVMGLASYPRMPRNSMPPFLVRAVSIVTHFPGASPDRVEQLVSSKIEEAVQEVSQVDYITSESRTGISIVTVSIKESETDLQPIFDRIRRKVDGITGDLPDGIIGPDVNDEVGDVFGILIGVVADDFTYAELKDMADDIRDELLKLPDAAKVEIAGEREERIFIDYDNARLAGLGLTQAMIQNILSGANIIAPGGDVVMGNERIILEPSGNFDTVRDLEQTMVTTGGGNRPVFLGDITRIHRGYIDPPNTIVRINGRNGLVLGIALKGGGNISDLGVDVDGVLRELQSAYPHGVDISRVASQDVVVNKSVDDFLGNLIQAVIVVLAVMLVFLGFRTGLVVASLIPMAIIMGLMLMSSLDIGLDKVSLAALIIALGMLVDNAIVVSESILVKLEQGLAPVEAAVASCKELIVPLLVSTLTTSAAFVAFYLAESNMGEIVGPIFVVVTVVLLSSWILAITVIPMFCATFLKVEVVEEKEPGRFRLAFRSLLSFSLRRSWLVVITLFLLFVSSIISLGWLPAIFMPDDDRNLVYADIDLPIGTSIQRTSEVVAQIEAYMGSELLIGEGRDAGVTDWSVYVGKGAPKYDLGYSPSQGSSFSAHMVVNTTSDAANQTVIDGLEKFCISTFPEITAKVSRLTTGGGSATPIAIRISGKEPEKLYRIVDGVKAQLRGIPGTKNIKDNWGMWSKKLVVDIDQTRAQLAGVTNYDIAVSLRTVLSGVTTSQFREGDKVIPIVMRNAPDSTMDISALESLNIFAQNSGKNVPLKQVADIQVAWQPSKIIRRDLYRTMTVEADLVPGFTANQILEQLEPWLEQESVSWSSGYKYKIGGESEDSAKAMNAVMVNLPVAFFVIVLLLVGQFNSIKKPIIVLLTIPLGFIGVVYGLLGAGSYFGFFSFLGIISLAGIVINNAIVLLDRIRIEEESGLSGGTAILAAADQRLRPIILTTATTSFGLIPLWLGGGPMFEPMAIAIIFGLLFATVITLIFVPVLYRILFRIDVSDLK